MAAAGQIKMDLSNVDACFPADYDEEQKATAKTIFYKELAEVAHRFYGAQFFLRRSADNFKMSFTFMPG